LSKPFIVLGDKTTHGGTVISADMTCDISGKYMARVTDKTVCPLCKGVFPIMVGAGDVVDGTGLAYARHMDSTACGAKLLSGQVTTFWDAQSSMGAGGGPGWCASSSAAGAMLAMGAADAGGAFAGGAAGDEDPPPVPTVVAEQTPTLCLECLTTAAARGDAIVAKG
jgi:uncharacterized Zn-binding protein involved in type VI secretion